MMEKKLYQTTHSDASFMDLAHRAKVFFQRISFELLITKFKNVYIYSPSLRQDLYQILNKCLISFIPNHINPNILNEANIDHVIDELVSYDEIKKSDTEIETYGSIEELKYPQEYENGGKNILDDIY